MDSMSIFGCSHADSFTYSSDLDGIEYKKVSGPQVQSRPVKGL